MNTKKLTLLAFSHTALHWASMGIIIPVMTLYLVGKGITYGQIGLTFALFSATTLFLELPTGGLADTYGRRKIYLIAMGIQAVALFLAVFANRLPVIAFAFCLMGASRALSSGTMDAYFADVYLQSHRSEEMAGFLSITEMAAPLALGISSLLGGWIPSAGLFGSGQAAYPLNFAAAGFFSLLQIGFTLVFVPADSPPAGSSGIDENRTPGLGNHIASSVKLGMVHTVLRILLVNALIWGFAISGLEQFWQPRLKGLLPPQGGTMIFGWLTAGYFLAGAGGSFLAGPLSKIRKVSYPALLFLSRFLMAGFFLLLAFQSRVGFFAVFYVTLFLFNGIQGPLEISLLNGAVPGEKRSTMYSLYSLILHGGGLIGSLFAGYFAQGVSISGEWTVAAVVLGLSSLLYFAIRRPVRDI